MRVHHIGIGIDAARVVAHSLRYGQHRHGDHSHAAPGSRAPPADAMILALSTRASTHWIPPPTRRTGCVTGLALVGRADADFAGARELAAHRLRDHGHHVLDRGLDVTPGLLRAALDGKCGERVDRLVDAVIDTRAALRDQDAGRAYLRPRP